MRKIKNIIILILAIVSTHSYAQYSSLSGKVTDETTGEPILFACVALYQNGVLLTGTESDIDGNYMLDSLHSGTYEVEASYVGYQTIRISDVIVLSGLNQITNISMSQGKGVNLEEIIVIEYKKPLIQNDNTTGGCIVTADEIKNLPTRSINGLSSTSAGVGSSDDGSSVNIRSSRTNATVYYIDGVAVRGPLSPNSELKGSQRRIHKKSRKNKKEIQALLTREDYNYIVENDYHFTKDSPLSTFSIDVDRASYSNLRRFINHGTMPPADAIRVEEMINYFDYEYPQPAKDEAFSVNTEYVECPWNKKHKLLHIGVQGKKVAQEDMPPANLVFLVDVSGSMGSPDKLPLVKKSLLMLIDKLKPTDRIALVTYAGATQVVLPSTEISKKPAIIAAIEMLGSGGSTAGASGIKLAYETARKYFLPKGNNRIILATDGDFNVGISSNADLQHLIEKERENGIFLSVLGYGTGNYQDSKMQMLANKGNGNHAYIDNLKEAEKVLVKEMSGTLLTIAKDVKIQIEFNPTEVSAYRLIGYENRILAAEDFNNDKKDAGELGAGHTVTAIYEILPRKGKDKQTKEVDPLKYQSTLALDNDYKNELATIKLRYKKPQGNKSKLIENAISTQSIALEVSSNNLRWSAAMAQFGMTIRRSKHLKVHDYNKVIALAESGIGSDDNGYRDEAIQLIQRIMEIDDPTMSGIN